ncbi:hypothetical protein GGF44_004933, partial [Coemansia sp. RSA 1694]
MDSFSHMYGNGQFNGGQMNPMGYPAQMMGGDHTAQIPPPYSRSPFSSAKAMPMPGTQLVSSRIASDADCGVFCHDGSTGSTTELHVRQMVGHDGAVFVEHVPGYHVVYVAVGESVDQAVRDSRLAAGGQMHRPASNKAAANRASAAAAASQRDRPLKPCNPFIMYRNHKIMQMRKENPEINQTEISREAANRWRNESEDVKEVFRARYREEKQVYDLKKCKRGRADSCAAESESEANDGLSTPSSKRSRNDSLGLGGGGSAAAQRMAAAKPRSRTMPNDMFGGSGARASIVTDLRKQLAARSGAAFFDAAVSSPYDAAMGHHAYADFGAADSQQQLPALMHPHHHQPMTIAPLVSYSPATMPADYTHDYALPPVADYATEISTDYAAEIGTDYAAAAAAAGQPEYHSFVNAMHGMGGGADEHRHAADDVTAAAAAAAADFYAAAADSIAAADAAASSSEHGS